MNQEKIGKFIAELRKEKNMTQQELADKLSVTDRAVSNWENGRRLPEYSLLKDLCDVLSISINELFAGKKISEENYSKVADENLSKIIKNLDKEDKIFEKKMIILLVITTLLTIIIITLLPLKTIKDVFILVMIILLAFIANSINMIALALKNNNRFSH